jgi:hypothetical protein
VLAVLTVQLRACPIGVYGQAFLDFRKMFSATKKADGLPAQAPSECAGNGRVVQAFDLVEIGNIVGAPSLRLRSGRALRVLREVRVPLMLVPREFYATRSRNEIFVHPSSTRTGPASPSR